MSTGKATWATTHHIDRSPFPTGKVKLPQYTLHVVSGPHQGQELAIGQELISIGRGDWCDVMLSEDRKVSKEHCELRCEPKDLVLRDCGSRNGIFVDDTRIYEAPVTAESKIQVGTSILQLRLQGQAKELQVRYHDDSNQLVGQSARMRQIFSMLPRLGARDFPVLLLGETGTGKTSIARALHEQSQQFQGPFVSVNCGALSPNLVESLFFGYEKGAFTGAEKRHQGYFEQADGGTLFLDEIGELPLELQTTFLDVLESGEIQRLGDHRKHKVDFRLLTATHRNLQQEAEEGRFRLDLFYRINVVALELPALRERLEDIPLLAGRLLNQLDPDKRLQLSDDALRSLQAHPWPGNVRQLYNVLKRTSAFHDLMYQDETPGVIDAKALQLPVARPSTAASSGAHTAPISVEAWQTTHDSLKSLLNETEKQAITATLQATDGDTALAAEQLGISRVWLYNRLKKHGITLSKTPR